MRYLTWKLVKDGEYFYGPEHIFLKNGDTLESAWTKIDSDGTRISLGYLNGNSTSLSEAITWDVHELNQNDALEFCKAISSLAYVMENEKIGAPLDI
jgi:hypothetical protein